jgi:hypothetical protein
MEQKSKNKQKPEEFGLSGLSGLSVGGSIKGSKKVGGGVGGAKGSTRLPKRSTTSAGVGAGGAVEGGAKGLLPKGSKKVGGGVVGRTGRVTLGGRTTCGVGGKSADSVAEEGPLSGAQDSRNSVSTKLGPCVGARILDRAGEGCLKIWTHSCGLHVSNAVSSCMHACVYVHVDRR